MTNTGNVTLTGITLTDDHFTPADEDDDIDVLLENWTNEYACLGYGAELYDDISEFSRQTGIRIVLP